MIEMIIPRGMTRPKFTHALSFNNATTQYRASVGLPMNVSHNNKNNPRGIKAAANPKKNTLTRLYFSEVRYIFLKNLRHAKIAPSISPTK